MSDRFNDDTFYDYYSYRGHLEPTDLQVSLVVGAQAPVKLSLALPAGARLKHALAAPPGGATLAMDMTVEAAAHLFAEIRERFREMDWPLPPEAIKRAEFQTNVRQVPPKSNEKW